MSAPQRIRSVFKSMLTCVLFLSCAQICPLMGQGGIDLNSPETEAAPGTFSYNGYRQPIVSLDGMWRFHPGDDAAWSEPTFDDSNWPLLRSDEPWSGQGYTGMSGFGWYRFRITVPANHPALALDLAPI